MTDTLKVLKNLKRSIKNDTFLYILLFIFNYGHRELHFSSITQRVSVALRSQYLFVVDFQQIKMSNACVSIVLHKYSLTFCGNVVLARALLLLLL